MVVQDVQDTNVSEAVPVRSLIMPGIQNNQLVPYPGEGRWHHDIFEKCCDCSNYCWMAWLCPVFPLAQMMERMKALGVTDGGGYREVLIGAVIWSMVDLMLTLLTKSSSYTLFVFCGIIACQLRVAMRVRKCRPAVRAVRDCSKRVWIRALSQPSW